jgi:NitT/TauT family transport system permease protein
MDKLEMLDPTVMLDDGTAALETGPTRSSGAPEKSRPPSAERPMWRLANWVFARRFHLRRIVVGAISIALFLCAWHLLTENRVNIHVRFTNVPSPRMVLEKAQEAAHSKQFAQNVVISCERIFLGFALAALIAVPLGLLMGRFEPIRTAIFPISELIRPIPAIAWVPMSIMLWPSNEESIVFITYLGSFFPILLNTMHGVATVDPILVRAARSLGASEADIFREVYFPSALPQIFTGLTIGVGAAWVSLIAAEMISGQFGVGYFTWEAYSLVQYADIALGMITIGLLGLLSSVAVRALGSLCMPWKR